MSDFPPPVSVLMPVYNTERYLARAIESILSQTFGDFEFLICDDESTDRSIEIAQSYAAKDARVRFLPLKHTGYVNVLRHGLAECRGGLVARMDSDDVALPERFAVQVDYLRQHPEVVAVGSRVQLIDPYDSPIDVPPHKLTHGEIDAELMRGIGWAMVHPVVTFRREAMVRVGGYREGLEVSEDCDLFLRLAEVGHLANLECVLLKYRQHLKSVNFTKRELQRAGKREIVRAAYRRRGLPDPANWDDAIALRDTPAPEQTLKRWGWAAIKAGNPAAARRHAWYVLKLKPLAADSWRLAYCALRGR